MNSHIELHLIRNTHEALQAEAGGLPAVHLEADECGECGRDIGSVHDKFVPLVIVLDAEHESRLCLACVSPITKSLG